MSGYATKLRQELCARNAAYAEAYRLVHVQSYGEMPVTVYPSSEDGTGHGNFMPRSFQAILKRPQWKRRLDKVHAQAARCLPRSDRPWRELDSSMSSDALLMNVFCHPRTMKSRLLLTLLGGTANSVPEFGCRIGVPLRNGLRDRTEVDMRIASLLVEAKLTEGDFQTAAEANLLQYRDFEEVFEVCRLPRLKTKYASYQLIRNVLAAHALGLSFCVLLDARRPDLLEAWYCIMSCIRIAELKTRCQVLTWQELSVTLPPDLREFLSAKYGV